MGVVILKGKNKHATVFIIVFSVIFVFIIGFIVFKFSGSTKPIKVDGKYTDNIYNNLVLSDGNLVRIGNRLYYNYNETNDIFRYGLHEISDAGDKTLFKPPVSDFALSDILAGMQSYDNNLLVGIPNYCPLSDENSTLKWNCIYSFNLDTGNPYVSKLLSDFSDEEILNYYVIQGKIYFATKTKVYLYSNDNYEKLMDVSDAVNINYQPYSREGDNFNGIYFNRENIYYISSSNNYFTVLETGSRKTKELFDMSILLQKCGISNVNQLDPLFAVVNGFAIFSISSFSDDLNSHYFKINLSNNEIEEINCKLTDFTVMNIYKDNLVLGSESDGLFIVDLKSNQYQQICNYKVKSVYVVDEKYVYFSDIHNKLYRADISKSYIDKIY